ncbi:MAG TPA: hypothetical protein VIF62_35275 [Labilithrix sp.]|jgi:hypothetical protein
MTMRLDIVTNDAGELVRREHARDLGANVVVAIYRLAKLAQMHDLQNQAFTRQLEQTHQIISDYCLRAGFAINVLFAEKAVFVAGQLLKGSRGVYEAAAELGEIFARLGGQELFIDRGLTRDELFGVAEQISIGFRSASHAFRSPTPKVRLRPVTDAARLRGLDLEDLSPDERIVRMYASAVVIMRRFFEDLQASKYILPRRIKRIAQSLVDLSDGSTPSYLGVTEVRNANFDEAGRAVNTAILAVSMAREITTDRTILAQIAMAAMMHDVARPRALALASSAGSAMPGMQGPSVLSEDQEDRLAAGAAAVLTALGRVNEPSITRTVLTFESLWLRRQTWLGPVYWGQRAATIHARMISISRRYNDLLTPEPGLLPPTPDYAVARLSEELTDPQDRAVLRMLISALGLLPMGTVVQLNTNETAEVVRGPKGPGERPRIKLLTDERGAPIAQPVEIELAQDLRRQVGRVISVDGWKKGLETGPDPNAPPPDYDPDADAPAHDVQLSEPPAMRAEAELEAVPMSVPAMPPPAQSSPPPGHISPLQPVVSSRTRADQYADQFAQWGQVSEPPAAPETPSESPIAARDSVSSSIQSGEHNSSASLPSLGSSPSAVAEAMGRMINDSLRPPAAVSGDRTVMSTGAPDEVAPRGTSRPKQQREPTARGNLAATPLPHVLVYMLDHALSGSVLFDDGTDNPDAIYFVRGVPSKIRLRDPVGLLGEMLVQGSFLETKAVDQAVEGARRLGILLGEYLVGHDLATREAVTWALEAQVLHKIAHIANLPPELGYSYYRDVDMLEGWGGGEVTMSAPLNPILASVRNWMDRARVRATLNRIGKHPLVLHDESDLTNLALLPEEQTTLDLIKSDPIPLSQLFKRNVAEEEVVSSLIYALAVTRQFAFKGQKKGPMAPRGVVRAQSAPPAAAPSTQQQISSKPSPPVSGSIPAVSAAPVPSSSQSKPIGSSPSRQIPAAAVAASSRPVTPAQAAEIVRTADGTGAPMSPSNAPVSSRKLPAAGPSAAAPRAIAPAARPQSPSQPGVSAPLPRPNPPQIRPIVQKTKGTVVGLQPAAPADARAPASKPPIVDVSPTDAPPPRESFPPGGDDAKTIMMPPKALFQNLKKAPPGAGGSPLSRPPPGLPSKAAPPKAAPPPAARPPANKPMPSGANLAAPPPPRPEKPTTKVDPEKSDDIEIELDD